MSVFGVILVRIQSECGKIPTKIAPNMDAFYAVTGFCLLLPQRKFGKKNDWRNSGFCSRFLHNIQPQQFLCLQWLLFVLLSIIFNGKNIFKKIPSWNIDLSITLKPQQWLCSSSCCLFLLHIKKWIVSLLMKVQKSGIFFSLNISITAIVLLYCLFFILGFKEYCKDLSEKRFEFVELLSQ